jgi:hypothetical protein
MRFYMKSVLSKVHVSKHALERFQQRLKGERLTDESAQTAILKIFQKTKPVRFKDEFMIRRLFRNNLQVADYYYGQGFIFVLSRDNPPTIVTIETTGHKKLGKDFFYRDGE